MANSKKSPMKIIEVTEDMSPAGMVLGALKSSRKKPGVVTALPAITYVRPSVKLDAAHIAAYAKVCGYSDTQGVPIIYPQMLTFPLMMAFFASPECPWPGMGTVHLANRIQQHAVLKAGDDLRVEVATGDLVAHEKGQVFNMEMRILRGDELVWDATQTLLRIGVKDPAGTKFISALNADLPLSRQADIRAASDIGRRYGKVSGDMNPIHLSALSAKLFGFRAAIAHGLWTKARALAQLMPPYPVAQASVNVEFKTPLFLPATASLWATHSELSTAFEVRNQKGDKPHLRGQITYA
jgi:acyl dehydratase